MTDLDARYSALCDALRAIGASVDPLRAEIVAAGALASLAYAGGAARCSLDLAALRAEWSSLARDVAREMYDRTIRAGTADHRYHAARERRWDAHTTVVATMWDDVMRGAVGAHARDRSSTRVEAAPGTSPQAEEGLLR